ARGRVAGGPRPGGVGGRGAVCGRGLAPLPARPRDPVASGAATPSPPVRQDLAFSIPEDVAAGDLVAGAREAAGPELREMRAFDVYHGEQLGPGRKSIAFAVTFQSPDRTLSDEDATRLRAAIVAALADRFGAELRA